MTPDQNPRDPRERYGGLSIDRILADHPEAIPILHRHLGASCFGCPGRFEETLEKGILLHEASPEDVYADLARVSDPV